MIQYGLDIPSQVWGFFTLEKCLVNLTLFEIEGKLGYERGRLKQGADFYIINSPSNISDFEIYGTSMFPGGKFENSNLQRAVNTESKKERDLRIFKKKRLIKVIPLQTDKAALRKHLSDDEYLKVSQINTHGMSDEDFLSELSARFGNSSTITSQVRQIFEQDKSVKRAKADDKMYPMAYNGSVPQWKLNKALTSRCVCRLTDYYNDIYQSVF